MGHQETYRHNEDYAAFLEGWPVSFFEKYITTLLRAKGQGRMLDVGCGVGQVVESLLHHEVEAMGVDVSYPNIRKAQARGLACEVYDGKCLPFEEGSFASVGAFNVLEHVDDPEGFLIELVRVVQPGGWVVVSSPNFFRVLGWADYHPRMRGIANKWGNLRRLLQKRRILKGAREHWSFDRMEPINRPVFSPDDDAIIATNPMEIAAFLGDAGCHIESVACTDRPVAGWLDACLNAGPWKYAMLNGFVVAKRL